MHVRYLVAASCLAVLAVACPRWDINGVVLQREEYNLNREEAIEGAVATLKCGAPPILEPDGGIVIEPFGTGGPAGRGYATTDGGDDAGPADAGASDAGSVDGGGLAGLDAGEPNTGTETATTAKDGTFRLSNGDEVGPHQNCEVEVTAQGFLPRNYSMDKICAHYEVHDGLLRCRWGFVLAEMAADPVTTGE
jgi:hypothetical protein